MISKFLVKRLEILGRNVGDLYSINTFGAVLGTFVTGFFLIMILGVKEATYVAGVINLLIAGIALALNKYLGSGVARESNPGKIEEVAKEDIRKVYPPKIVTLALWAFGLSGLCALAYEVLWTRALIYLLDNTTHAFTTMLVTFLFGIAAGSYATARFIDTTGG